MKLGVPIISSNMDTITESQMASVMTDAGGVGALHRFMSITQNVEHYLKHSNCFVSIGVNRDWQERTLALHKAGARFFVVDIAHGHSQLMRTTVEWLRGMFDKDIFIMAGNVGTADAVRNLDRWTVDAIKIGLSGGFVCETKNVTGVQTPMFTTVQLCSQATSKPIIADGGARSYGDVAKAIGAGATAVMSGYFFAGCPETPPSCKGVNVYRGMASRDAMNAIRVGENLPTPEGRSVEVSAKPSAKVVVEELAGGLRSAYSYVGARNTAEFYQKVQFGYRR
jgi:IMP dehydrogenase